MAFIRTRKSKKEGKTRDLHYLVESYRMIGSSKVKQMVLYQLGESKSLDEARRAVQAKRRPIIEELLAYRKELKEIKQGKTEARLPWVQKERLINKIKNAKCWLRGFDEELLELELLQLEYRDL